MRDVHASSRAGTTLQAPPRRAGRNQEAA
jgi:hypothetical protein